MPQLNSFPAPAFLFTSFSPLTVFFFPSPSSTRVLPFRSTAPRICRSRPWKDFLSRDLYAESADAAEEKVTYATPLGSFVLRSIGMCTCISKNGRLVNVRTRRITKRRFRKEILAIYFPRFSSPPLRESDVPIGDSHRENWVWSVILPTGAKGAPVSMRRESKRDSGRTHL